MATATSLMKNGVVNRLVGRIGWSANVAGENPAGTLGKSAGLAGLLHLEGLTVRFSLWSLDFCWIFLASSGKDDRGSGREVGLKVAGEGVCVSGKSRGYGEFPCDLLHPRFRSCWQCWFRHCGIPRFLLARGAVVGQHQHQQLSRWWRHRCSTCGRWWRFRRRVVVDRRCCRWPHIRQWLRIRLLLPIRLRQGTSQRFLCRRDITFGILITATVLHGEFQDLRWQIERSRGDRRLSEYSQCGGKVSAVYRTGPTVMTLDS